MQFLKEVDFMSKIRGFKNEIKKLYKKKIHMVNDSFSGSIYKTDRNVSINKLSRKLDIEIGKYVKRLEEIQANPENESYKNKIQDFVACIIAAKEKNSIALGLLTSYLIKRNTMKS